MNRNNQSQLGVFVNTEHRKSPVGQYDSEWGLTVDHVGSSPAKKRAQALRKENVRYRVEAKVMHMIYSMDTRTTRTSALFIFVTAQLNLNLNINMSWELHDNG